MGRMIFKNADGKLFWEQQYPDQSDPSYEEIFDAGVKKGQQKANKKLTEALQKIKNILQSKEDQFGLNPSENDCLDFAKEALKYSGIDQ